MFCSLFLSLRARCAPVGDGSDSPPDCHSLPSRSISLSSLSDTNRKRHLAVPFSIGGAEGNRSLRARCAPVGDGSDSPPDCHSLPSRSISLSSLSDTNRKRHLAVPFSIGGAEGNRTPVRKDIDRTFSGCSRFFDSASQQRQSAGSIARELFSV